MSRKLRIKGQSRTSSIQPAGDNFRKIEYFDIVSLGMSRRIAQHDWAIGTRDGDRGNFCLRQLSKPLLIYAPGGLFAAIVGDEKLRAASPATIRILAVM